MIFMEQKIYHESMLNLMKKPELYTILVELGIEEGVAKNAPAEEMVAKILAKMLSDESHTAVIEENTSLENESLAKENEGNEESYFDDDLPKYTPDQLIKSSTYSHRRDVLRALLDDDKTYSHAQIASVLKNFYESEDKTLQSKKDGEKA